MHRPTHPETLSDLAVLIPYPPRREVRPFPKISHPKPNIGCQYQLCVFGVERFKGTPLMPFRMIPFRGEYPGVGVMVPFWFTIGASAGSYLDGSNMGLYPCCTCA